jgi:hypothetical protein
MFFEITFFEIFTTTTFPLFLNLAPPPNQEFQKLGTCPHLITGPFKIQISVTGPNPGEIIGKGIYQKPSLYSFSINLVPP